MRGNIQRCTWCGKNFITEEIGGHPCFKERNPVKDITIDFSYETESEEGDKIIHAYDLQGNVYRLTKPNPLKLAELKKAEELLQASDESLQGKSRRTNRRGLDSSRGMKAFIV